MMRLKYFIILIVFASLVQACTEKEVFNDPYAGGKVPLGVKLSTDVLPSPIEALPGEVVSFGATGLSPYKAEVSFYFNGQKAEVVSVTDTEIKVKIPLSGSTGRTSVMIGDQVFFGPAYKVSGKIGFDTEWQAVAGTNGLVNSFYKLDNDERIIFVGGFNRYNNQGGISPYRGLIRIFKNGTIDQTFRSGGANGSIYSLTKVGDKYFVAGNFSAFYPYAKNVPIENIDNITRLNADGSLDSVRVTTSTGRLKGVASFNGGTDRAITRMFSFNNKIIGLGNFKYHLSHRYNVPKKDIISGNMVIKADSIVTDSVETPQIVRFSLDGNLDRTYRFNSVTGKGLEAGNGSLNDGYMHPDGKLVIVGNFTRFDGQPVNRIVRLDADGGIDPSFNIGNGANSFVYSVTFNETTRKFFLTGDFNSFNGTSVNGMVKLNENGTIDDSFKARQFGDGVPTFVKQLSNGFIVVSGSFGSYDNSRRAGFAVLTSGGELAPGYNTTGTLDGILSDVYESTNSLGNMTLILMGSFTKFDGKNIENVTRITLEQ